MLKLLKKAALTVQQQQQWINDLQSDMFINCVYCGHRYGPNDEVPASMADVLKEHIEQCPDHPMSALKNKLATCEQELGALARFAAGTEEEEET